MRSCFCLLGMIGVALIVSNCQYDPDRVSDGDANPVIVEYRKIYSASKAIGPDSTLTLLEQFLANKEFENYACLLYTSPSPRDATTSRMPSSA